MDKIDETHLLWVDLEMTGLDETTHHIIEIASIITDKDLNVIAKGPNLAIHQPDYILDLMDEWCTKTHGESGLTERVQKSTVDLRAAEEQTLLFARRYLPDGKIPLCGNSIGTDRRFIKKYMPELHQFCHYRNLDVSTLKELAKRWYPTLPPYEKKGSHQALEDIEESIEELRYFRRHLFVSVL